MAKGIGSGILRTPELLVDLVGQLGMINTCCSDFAVKSVPYPVSVKLRIHENVPTTINIMKQLKSVGVKAFTVHGREWWQKGEKRGKNDWDAIKYWLYAGFSYSIEQLRKLFRILP